MKIPQSARALWPTTNVINSAPPSSNATAAMSQSTRKPMECSSDPHLSLEAKNVQQEPAKKSMSKLLLAGAVCLLAAAVSVPIRIGLLLAASGLSTAIPVLVVAGVLICCLGFLNYGKIAAFLWDKIINPLIGFVGKMFSWCFLTPKKLFAAVSCAVAGIGFAIKNSWLRATTRTAQPTASADIRPEPPASEQSSQASRSASSAQSVEFVQSIAEEEDPYDFSQDYWLGPKATNAVAQELWHQQVLEGLRRSNNCGVDSSYIPGLGARNVTDMPLFPTSESVPPMDTSIVNSQMALFTVLGAWIGKKYFGRRYSQS